jgi:hypothetical protein
MRSVWGGSHVRSLFTADDRGVAPSRNQARAAPVRITAVAERTSGQDEHLGFLLRDMRLALPMTPGELALRLGTTIDVITTLEQGRLRALPHWDETQRLVGGLCALHHVDPWPILNRILEQTSPTQYGAPPARGPGALKRTPNHPATVGAPPVTAPEAYSAPRTVTAPRQRQPQPAPRATRQVKPAKEPRRWRRRLFGRSSGRVLMAVAGPMVMIAALAWTVQAQPRALRSAIDVLPTSVATPMLAGLDSLAARMSPRRDGMRWIEVADPSTRKADKLEVRVGSR